MNVYKNAKIKITIVLFLLVMCIGSVQSSVLANQMISDECLQNPENCQESPSAANEEAGAAVGITAFDYIKMLFALLFVLGLMILILRLINRKNVVYQRNSLVRNIGGVSVGPQKSIQVVQIGQTLYVVGVGEDVQLIKEISNPEEMERLLSYYNEKQSITSTTPYIAELIQKVKKKPAETEEKEKLDFGNILNERLTNIKKERRQQLENWKEKEDDK